MSKQNMSTSLQRDFYVYVYIDPRNYEEFYYGKGRGSRKEAHLDDHSDSQKAQRIKAIHGAGLVPIIRVVASNLTQDEALLVEKTLLWKLGRQLTNLASGHFSEKFRPHDTLHRELPGFDYARGLCYFNVGEGVHRNWDDYREFGFISAGQGRRWRDAILAFQQGDVVAAYLKNHGYVGIGELLDKARPIRSVSIQGKPLLDHTLRCQRMDDNVQSDELCEHAAPVRWIASVERNEAKWNRKAGLYTTTHVRATLDGQPLTIDFLQQAFGIDIRGLIK